MDRVQSDLTVPQKPQKKIKDIQLVELLPVQDAQQRLKSRWAVLVSRVVCKFLQPFKHLEDVVVHHISHPYTAEMSEKSAPMSRYFTFPLTWLSFFTSLILTMPISQHSFGVKITQVIQFCAFFLSLSQVLFRVAVQRNYPNIAAEMAQLIINNHEKYVSCKTTPGGQKEFLQSVPLHKDQLFEERARNSQWTFQDGLAKSERLEVI